MKIVSWNVNSLRVRLAHVKQFLREKQPDLLALQETKCDDDKFPHDALIEDGYHVIFAGQKAYNGVAILAKNPLSVEVPPAYFAHHEQKRLLVTRFNGIYFLNVYVPNGQEPGSDKYAFKLEWLNELKKYLETLAQTADKIIVLGDFNIAPTENDAPTSVKKESILVSTKEREALQSLERLGFVDSFRYLSPGQKQYTWWDYRLRGFEKNLGYRIDHILLSPTLISYALSFSVDTFFRGLEQPSDHAPVVLELAL